MPIDPIVRTDAGLLAFSDNFSRQVADEHERLGITPVQSAAYSTVQELFAQRLGLLNNPATRTPVAVTNKNLTRKALLSESYLLANIILSQPEITAAELQALGISRRKSPTTRPPPEKAPDMDLIGVGPTTMTVRVHNNETVSRRRKPAEAEGAAVWSFVGPVPPLDPNSWRWEGNFTRQIVTLNFGVDVPPGSKVWARAAWYNRRGQRGPGSEPLEARLPGISQNPEGPQPTVASGGDAFMSAA